MSPAAQMLLYLCLLLLGLGWIVCLISRSARSESMKEVWYLAHPVSGDIEGNVANAIAWIKWLTLNEPSRVYIAPWVAEVQAFSKDIGTTGDPADEAFYERVLADDMDVVRHLDGILLVGGRVSRGMKLERDAAIAAGIRVIDASCYREPPQGARAATFAEALVAPDFPDAAEYADAPDVGPV